MIIKRLLAYAVFEMAIQIILYILVLHILYYLHDVKLAQKVIWWNLQKEMVCWVAMSHADG